MKIAAISILTVGFVVTAVPRSWAGADAPAPAAKPATAIIITNKAEGQATARTPYLSAGLPEVVKMHKAGVDATVLLAFIQNSPVAYNPSAKEIIYLRDSGISNEVISALLRRGGELRERAAEAQREERRTGPPPVAPAAPANPSPPQATASPTVVYANTAYPVYTAPTYVPYPVYSYASPSYYNYSSCRPYYRHSYYPSVYASYGWGGSPRFGFSVGFGGGRYSAWGGGFRHGGFRHGGSFYCRR